MRFLNWNRSYYAWINFAGTTLFIVTAITFVNQATAQEVFSYGSEGCIVRAIQRKLGLQPTGSYDRITSQRVAEFQREEGLPVDGIANIWVLQALNVDPNEASCLNQELAARYRNLHNANRGDRDNIGGTGTGTGTIGVYYVIANPNLLLRSAPSVNSSVIGNYNYGDMVEITSERAYADGYTWARVFKGGWIAADYLSAGLGADGIVGSRTLISLNTSANFNNGGKSRPYVVVIPISSGATLSQVRRYVNNAFLEDSKLGKFVNSGAYTSYDAAKHISMRLRRLGLDARVVYHP